MAGALQGKVVVVTGAGAGIGLAVARAAVAAGAKVLAVSIDPSQAPAVTGAGAAFLAADLGDAAAPGLMVAEALRLFGRVDGLVANAGLTIRRPFLEIPVEELDLMWRVNQRGAMLSAQAVARAIVDGGHGGSIVLVGSNHAKASLAGYEAYAGTKAALAAMARAMAWSLGPMQIRVNTLAPGLTETEALTDHLRAHAELAAGYAAAHATQRWNRMNEVAAIAVFLLSDAASAMTGAELIADQGLSARLGRFED